MKNIIIHHEAGNNGFVAVNEYHRKKWNFKSSLGFYIGYQLYIDKDGTIHKGRALTEEGAHCRGWNSNSIGICLQGNFVFEKPSSQQKEALGKLLPKLQSKFNIPNQRIYGHGEIAPTICPGELMVWIKEYRAGDPLQNIANQLEAIKRKIAMLLQQIADFIHRR